jgi:hypothetical protein
MSFWRRLLTDPDLTDWLLAALITAAAEIEILITPTAGHGSPAVRAITSLGLLAVAWRRRLPLVSVAVVCASTIVCQLVGGWAQDVVPLLTAFLLAYSLGAYAGNLAVVLGACVIGSTPLTLHALGSQSGFSRIESLIWVLGIETVLPIVVGRLVRSRARVITRLRQQNLALIEERESRALEATLEERLRLALHLHGVVAVSVQAIIGEVAVAQADSGSRGLAAVQQVESIARDALGSMRGILLDLTSAEVR